MVEIIDGGITTPQGFKATGVHSGVKYRSLDMGLLYSEVPATAFMAFTSNNVKAAPVQLMMNDHSEKISAVIVNSGNANALTGRRGYEDAQTMQKAVAAELNLRPLRAGVPSNAKMLPNDQITLVPGYSESYVAEHKPELVNKYIEHVEMMTE